MRKKIKDFYSLRQSQCPSFISIVMIKYSDKSSLLDKGIYFSLKFQYTVHHYKAATWAFQIDSHTESTVKSKEK